MENQPKNILIEKTAGEFAGVWYDEQRSLGRKFKEKSAKEYAQNNFEKFIAPALQILTSMLGRSDISDHLKMEIYDAITERANDTKLDYIYPHSPILADDLKKRQTEQQIENIITDMKKVH